ncbi:MAG TPA: glycosyltransferase family 4 protein [Steroidobacteraceae bacterium]|nr:glycosyltransferase family 4 protein [Steroidobacteraceae bacterium]
MKVLLVHNYYGSTAPSGENLAYECDVELLKQHGHEVVSFTTHSDELRAQRLLGPLRGAVTCVWNPVAEARLRALIHKEKPDVMHVHNVFPRLSPAIFGAADGSGTATVLTLHNYRIFCAAGTGLRGRQACTLCADKNTVMPALRFRCYRNSRLATMPIALSISLHRSLGTLDTHVDAFIALTQFQRDFFVSRGLIRGERTHVRANFMPGSPQAMDWDSRARQVVYVGRLSDDKGVDVLINAWKLWGSEAPPLVIIGDGPRRGVLERMAREQVRTGQIHFTGQRQAPETHAILRSARLVVIPSRAFEGFPMVIREAFAFGVPLVVSDVGALASLVVEPGCGVAFTVGDARALVHELQNLWGDPVRMRRMALAAFDAYRERHSEQAAYASLMSVYAAAMAERRTR